MDHEKKAMECFEGGCNCAQSVFCAFSDDFGIDKETALKLTGAMGGGIGGTHGVCGAVSSMALICGLKNSSTDVKDKAAKEKVYALTKEKMEDFKNKFGSYNCGELLALLDEGKIEKNPDKPCDNFVKYAVKLAEK